MRNGDGTVHRRHRRVVAWVLAGAMLAAAPASSASADPGPAGPGPADAGGLPSWPPNPDWQRYVPGPLSDDVKPRAIVRTHGSVVGAEALVNGQGSTVLTVEPGGRPAIVVLDYG